MKDLLKSLRYTLLALLASLLVGAVIIVVTDIDALKVGDYGKAFSTVLTAYKSLFEGSFWGVRSISNTITGTTPLLLSGLAVSVAFKAGLFNIGATGQMLVGGMTALWVGFTMSGPGWLQVPLAVLAGAIGGAIYGGIAGVLKARTGAHEVITTIMLNSIASFLVLWLLKTTVFQREGRPDPISKLIADEAHLPRLFGFLEGRSDLVAHSGLFVALSATYGYWYLLTRTTLGFELRATGLNSDAAKYAGMKSKTLMVVAMLLAGGFAGMAGATEVLGTYGYASTSLAGNIGFDAIAVALLGQSSPIGTLVSALLFGALQAGGRSMQAHTDVPVDLIIVLRALIVVFVAAPLLVKAMFRVKSQVSAQGQTFRGWGG
ncbi:MAG: ABC transporter permease [Actinobacteria bacterium]|nr:ABC transporter permease [Actinomycetota bacterium]